MHLIYKLLTLISFTLISTMFAQNSVDSNKTFYGQFSFEMATNLPGKPEQVFDLATGDISGWWDHSMSENPLKFYIDPIPGGGFYEIFDEKGNGVKHAEVIYADRGKMFRFDGPLGLSGTAIQLVCTYQFEPVGNDSTNLKLTVNCSGQMQKNLDKIVESVWHHFIFDQFKPYVKEKMSE